MGTEVGGQQVGAFELVAELGRGGMGRVWQARHIEQQQPVAIKFMTSERAQSTAFVSAFEQEVLSMARLDHPNIALVLDYGTLGSSVGELPAGAPFIVMEYVPGVTLKHMIGALDWPLTASILRQLLFALAHAHSYGIIHRDLKPHNVVLAEDNSLKLLDFGIAYNQDTFDEHTDKLERLHSTGTPKYMAPEQIFGEWRQQGAWTDLYSFGALAWELVTGAPVFDGAVQRILTDQVSAEPGPFRPAFCVPVELEGWLRTLLRKSPGERFLRAADALDELESFVDALATPGLARRSEPESVSESAEFTTSPDTPTLLLDLHDATNSTQRFDLQTRDVRRPSGRQRRAGIAKIPRVLPQAPRRARLELLGCGLGLWGVRHIPVVGRAAQQRALWNDLFDSASGSSARVVELVGGPGTGKSRLAHWISQRGHELGVCHVLRANHSPTDGPLDALANMLSRYFCCHGLSRAQAVTLLEERFGGARLDYQALAEIITAADTSQQQVSRIREFATTDERNDTIIRLLEVLCEERAVLWWLDDAHWGSDTLALVERLLTTRRELPVFVVLTVREDLLARSLRAEQALARVMDQERTSSLRIGPLDDRAQERLIRKMLALEDDLTAQIVARTQGNPLFARQLIDEWVLCGQLEPGGAGFRLVDGVELSIPDDLHGLWEVRLAHLFEGFPTHDTMDLRRALELAAALGAYVDTSEWRELCARHHIELPLRFVEVMISQNLAEAEPSGWSFAHAMFRESLTRAARDAGRWERYHSAIAEMLERRVGSLRHASQRIATHLLEARDYEHALTPLARAIERCFDFGELGTAEALLDEYDRAVEARRLNAQTRAHARQKIYRGQLARFSARRDDAIEVLEAAIDLAAEKLWKLELAMALAALATLHEDAAEFDDAVELLAQAERLYAAIGRIEDQARALVSMGTYLSWVSRIEPAHDRLQQALALCQAVDVPSLQGLCQVRLSMVMLQREDFIASRALVDAGLASAARVGNRMLEARAHNAKGHLEAGLDDYAAARSSYLESARLFEPLVELAYLSNQINVGLIDAIHGETQTVRMRMTMIRDRLEELGNKRMIVGPIVALASLEARDADWAKWDDLFDQFLAYTGRGSELMEMIPMVLERSLDATLEHGESVRAERVAREIARIWSELERPERAEEILHRLPSR